MQSRLRPSPATAIALIALFVSLGGTAAALSGSNTVFTDDIANDTRPAGGGNPAGGLTAVDLRPNAVGQSEIAATAVRTAEIGTLPAARATSTTDQSIPDAPTVITLNSEVFDNANMHNNTTNNSRLTAPASGIYQINGRVYWLNGQGGEFRGLDIRKNGVGIIAGETRAPIPDGNQLVQNISTLARLNAGEYIELLASDLTNSAEISRSEPGAPELSLHWVSP
jgi:hypothetical protein